MLLFILAFIIPSVFAYDRDDCNCETLLRFDGCDWVNVMNPQTGTTGRVECNNVVITTKLENADLRGADFNSVNFAQGYDRGLVGNSVGVENVTFRGADFTNVDFYSVKQVDFKFATFNSNVYIIMFAEETDFAYASGDITAGSRDGYDLDWRVNNVIGTNVNFRGNTYIDQLYEIVDQINAAYADGAASVKANETELVAAYKELKNC